MLPRHSATVQSGASRGIKSSLFVYLLLQVVYLNSVKSVCGQMVGSKLLMAVLKYTYIFKYNIYIDIYLYSIYIYIYIYKCTCICLYLITFRKNKVNIARLNHE